MDDEKFFAPPALRMGKRCHRLHGDGYRLSRRPVKAPRVQILEGHRDSLANRRNVSRFYNSALGLRTSDDVADLMRRMAADPPRLVIYRHDDKYNTDESRAVMDFVRSTYVRIETLDGAEVYRLR